MASPSGTTNSNKMIEGTTSNNNEITEEGMNLGTTSSNDEGTSSNNNEITEEGSGTSSNNNEITEEGTTSNNNDIKEGMNSTGNNNDISGEQYCRHVSTNICLNTCRKARGYNNEITEEGSGTSSNNEITEEDDVRVLVAYNGKWRWDGEKWLFENSKGSIIVVSKYVTLSQITNILHAKFNVQPEFYDLKLEVHYSGGSPWFPIIEIEDDDDLSMFISESLKTKLPLCVTRVDKVVEVNGAEQERKGDTVENRLLKAIRKNDWVKAREIVNTEEVTWISKLVDSGITALHFVAGRYYDNDVLRDILVGINSELLITTVDNKGRNLAHFAAIFGNTKALRIILDSNPKCLFTRNKYGYLPIYSALHNTEIETFLYLFKQTKSYKVEYDELFRDEGGFLLLNLVIDKGLIDVAYELINDHPSLATIVYEGNSALECIIEKPELFYSGTHYNLFERFVYSLVPIENKSMDSTNTADVENQETPKRRCLHDVISWFCFKLWETTLLHVPHVKHLKDDKVKHNTTIKLLRRICEEVDKTYTESDIDRLYSSSLCLAVENNTGEAIDVLTKYFWLLCETEDICQLIVLSRSEKVYNYFLHHDNVGQALFTASQDNDDNNILHLAGRLAPIHKLNAASGAALQMQRELQWFEEVKKLVGIAHTRALNINKETPMMVFRKEHKELRNDGEDWMKKTADSYTISAALIITIVFAAAITVPGGNDDKTGKPIYETKPSLIIFAISDAVSLFTAATSLLLFLSILTARYADEDFLYKLPKRLIFGLVMLFVSVTSMMIAFSAALYIMFGQEKAWILIPIGVLACLPIASFVTLQFPLLFELISSTYGRGIFGKEKDWQTSANAHKKKRA